MSKADGFQEDEKEIIHTVAHEFVKKLKITQMTQTYKMPLLLPFYNAGNTRLKFSAKDRYESCRDFYSKSSNSTDFLRNKNTKDYKHFGEKEFLDIAKNPKDAFMNSAKEFFNKDGDYYCLPKTLKTSKITMYF